MKSFDAQYPIHHFYDWLWKVDVTSSFPSVKSPNMRPALVLDFVTSQKFYLPLLADDVIFNCYLLIIDRFNAFLVIHNLLKGK